MPRRIPDFPDSFHSWNFLSSIGSGITFFSFAIFSSFSFESLVYWRMARKLTIFSSISFISTVTLRQKMESVEWERNSRLKVLHDCSWGTCRCLSLLFVSSFFSSVTINNTGIKRLQILRASRLLTPGLDNWLCDWICLFRKCFIWTCGNVQGIAFSCIFLLITRILWIMKSFY